MDVHITDPALLAELREAAEEVLVEDQFRYGGNVWPAEVGGRRRLWLLGDEWYECCIEREYLVRLTTRGGDAGARETAIREFGGYVVQGDAVVPVVPSERDARWHDGTVYVRHHDGGSAAVRSPDEGLAPEDLTVERITWGERDHRYVLHRGHVFEADMRWRTLMVDGVTAPTLDATHPQDWAGAGRAVTTCVLITGTGDPAEPLWRALARLVTAAWRAPSVWHEVRRGPRLRHAPAVAVEQTGLRWYGIVAHDPAHAAEVAAAFGVHWAAWSPVDGSDDHVDVAVLSGDQVMATGRGRVEAGSAPAEGDALWDDEHFGGGALIGRRPQSLPDAVAEMRSVLALEQELERRTP